MNTAVINIKTQPIIKERAQSVAKELGFSLSSLVNAYLKQLIQTRTIHFSAETEIPNKKTLAIMKQAEVNLRKGNTSPIFTTNASLIAKDPTHYMHSDTMQQWLKDQGI